MPTPARGPRQARPRTQSAADGRCCGQRRRSARPRSARARPAGRPDCTTQPAPRPARAPTHGGHRAATARTRAPRQPSHIHPDGPHHHRGAGPWPRRRRPRRHRPCRHARKRRSTARGAPAARPHQRHHRGGNPHARLPDARRRLLCAPGHPRAKGPARAGRPFRQHPRRRVHHPRRQGRQRVCAEPGWRLQHGCPLAGQQGKPGRPGGRDQRAVQRPARAARAAGHEHHRTDQRQPEAGYRAAGRDRRHGPSCTSPAWSRQVLPC